MNIASNKKIQELNPEHNTLDFDYGDLPAKQVKYLKKTSNELKGMVEKASAQLIEIGQKLIEVKGKVGHGHFITWLNAEFGWDRSTAWKMMQVAEKCYRFKDLTIGRSALYLLSSNAFSDKEREAFAKRAKEGECITHKTLKIALLLKQEKTGDPTWNEQTPKEVLRLIAQVLGKTDCAICFESSALPTKKHCSPTEEALSNPLNGKVFLDPPNGKSTGSWVEHLLTGFEREMVTEAICFVPIKIEADWFQRLSPFPRCFVKEENLSEESHFKRSCPMMVVYLGPHRKEFVNAFKQLGDCYECVGRGHDAKVIDIGPA